MLDVSAAVTTRAAIKGATPVSSGAWSMQMSWTAIATPDAVARSSAVRDGRAPPGVGPALTRMIAPRVRARPTIAAGERRSPWSRPIATGRAAETRAVNGESTFIGPIAKVR